MDLVPGSTKVKIWYITQRLIDFSTAGSLPMTLDRTGESEKEREERERGRDQRAAHFVLLSLTRWPHWTLAVDGTGP